MIRSQDEKFGYVPVKVVYHCENGCKPAREVREHDDAAKKGEFFKRYDLSSRFAHFEEGLMNKKTGRLPRDFLASCLGLRGLNKSPRQGSRPMELTDSFVTLLQSFDPVFTAPTYQTFVVIITGWILSQRHRYVTEVIFSSGHVGDGHWSRFHRFFSHAAWDIDTFSSAWLSWSS